MQTERTQSIAESCRPGKNDEAATFKETRLELLSIMQIEKIFPNVHYPEARHRPMIGSNQTILSSTEVLWVYKRF